MSKFGKVVEKLLSPFFLHTYINQHQCIDPGHFIEICDSSPHQLLTDVNWLMGVLQAIIHNPLDPALYSAAGDGILALENLIDIYSNGVRIVY